MLCWLWSQRVRLVLAVRHPRSDTGVHNTGTIRGSTGITQHWNEPEHECRRRCDGCVLTTDHVALSAFAEKCVQTCIQYNLTGLMLDYEPASRTTTAAQYADLIRVIAATMHMSGKQIGVFLAGWGILGNWSAYKHCGADVFATMDYYPTGGSPGSPAKVDAILSAGIPASKLSIGIATTGWNQSALTSYLNYIESRSISQVDVWWCPTSKTDPRVNISSTVTTALGTFVSGRRNETHQHTELMVPRQHRTAVAKFDDRRSTIS